METDKRAAMRHLAAEAKKRNEEKKETAKEKFQNLAHKGNLCFESGKDILYQSKE